MAAPKDTAAKKDRRPARTIDERIAELQAKAEARAVKDQAKAIAAIAKLDDQIVKLESKLGDLYVKRDEARAVLGDEPEVENPMVEEPTA